MTITSNHETEESLAAILEARGIKPDVEPSVASVPAASPGETPAGKPSGETAPPSEAGDKKTQEAPTEPPKTDDKQPVETKPREHDPNRGNFASKLKKEQLLRERIQQDLELERGDKEKLKARLEEVEAKLAAMQPKADEPAKDATPQRPKRPTLASCDFDQEKLETALDQYDTDLEKYEEAMRAKSVADALAERDAKDAERTAKAEADRIYNEFVERRDQGAAEIADYQEILESVPDFSLPQFVELAIIQSEVPAHLIHHFLKDASDNDGKDLARIARLDPLLQVKELTKLETRLAMEREQAAKNGKPKPVAKVVEEAPVKEDKPVETAPPAKPVVKKEPVEPPIEPVGGRTGAKSPSLSEAGEDIKKYIALRNQGVNRP